MLQKSLILFTTLAFIFFITLTAVPGQAGEPGPASMELKTPGGKKSSRFPHRKHQKNFTCDQCHHDMTDAGGKAPYVQDMEIKRCISCHNHESMSDPQLNSFKLAAHGLCKECHKQNKDSAPTKCSGCHIK